MKKFLLIMSMFSSGLISSTFTIACGVVQENLDFLKKTNWKDKISLEKSVLLNVTQDSKSRKIANFKELKNVKVYSDNESILEVELKDDCIVFKPKNLIGEANACYVGINKLGNKIIYWYNVSVSLPSHHYINPPLIDIDNSKIHLTLNKDNDLNWKNKTQAVKKINNLKELRNVKVYSDNESIVEVKLKDDCIVFKPVSKGRTLVHIEGDFITKYKKEPWAQHSRILVAVHDRGFIKVDTLYNEEHSPFLKLILDHKVLGTRTAIIGNYDDLIDLEVESSDTSVIKAEISKPNDPSDKKVYLIIKSLKEGHATLTLHCKNAEDWVIPVDVDKNWKN